MAQPSAVLMTADQFRDLGDLLQSTHNETRDLQRLAQAAQTIDRCDGLVPQQVRAWVRCLDGWNSESDTSPAFVINLAKATSTGELLEEIRRVTNVPAPSNIDEWDELRSHVVEHFLSACEEIKLQAQLEKAKQRLGETPAAYIRRFRGDATRAYTQTRSQSEEERVVGAFLRGFADRTFAERLFRKGPHKKLHEAVKAALDLETQRERMEQVLHQQGHEPMEVGVTDALKGIATNVGTMNDMLRSVSARLDKLEKQPRQQQRPGQQQALQPSSATQAPQRPAPQNSPYKWAEDGKPICAYCQKKGHKQFACRKKQADRKSANPPPAAGR